MARMAELDPDTQEEFVRGNAMRPLMSTLAMDTILDDPKLQSGKTSIHSLVHNTKELAKNDKVP